MTAQKFKNLIGIEIGGPSSSFGLKSFFPIYLYAQKIDDVNYSAEVVLESKIKESNNYQYLNEQTHGCQFINEGSELKSVPNNKYDFLLSSHSLEHVANPIKALKRWREVLKSGGKLCLILPDKRFTFDCDRPYTTFEHLLSDYQNNVDEHDDTHFEEVIRLHNLSKDIVQSKPAFEDRTHNNFQNRHVHHHLFSMELVVELLNYCGFKVTLQKEFKPFHLFTIAEKL